MRNKIGFIAVAAAFALNCGNSAGGDGRAKSAGGAGGEAGTTTDDGGASVGGSAGVDSGGAGTGASAGSGAAGGGGTAGVGAAAGASGQRRHRWSCGQRRHRWSRRNDAQRGLSSNTAGAAVVVYQPRSGVRIRRRPEPTMQHRRVVSAKLDGRRVDTRRRGAGHGRMPDRRAAPLQQSANGLSKRASAARRCMQRRPDVSLRLLRDPTDAHAPLYPHEVRKRNVAAECAAARLRVPAAPVTPATCGRHGPSSR